MADTHDRTDPPTGSPAPSSSANPGYALGQLARALATEQEHPDAETRDRAGRRVADWLRVFGGMLSGALRVGSRTPVRGVPVWATTRVAAGGFATGDLLAGGPLLDHEEALLAALPEDQRDGGRAALNAFYLTEEGLGRLAETLESGRYRVGVPEEGALLAVAWLATHGHADAARGVLDAIGPWFGRLRFYPAPADGPPPDHALVRLEDVGDGIARLGRAAVPADLLTQTEAYTVWLPHADAVVALLAETVEGETPRLVAQHADGTSTVEGGWPLQTFPDGWAERARALLADYDRLRVEHPRSGKPERASANPARLRRVLATAADDPSRLTGRDVGAVRTALAQIRAKRGLPGSDRLAALRAEQARVAALPTKVDWATVLADRLGAFDAAAGLAPEDVDALLGPVTSSEAERHGLPEGEAIPGAFRPALLRATDATPEQHVAWGTIPSAETLATVVPRLAARVRSAGFSDPALRRLDEAVYAAFRRRRSVLLLDLQSQAKLRELPWVAALEPFRESGPAVREAARDALARVVGLALASFPHQPLPNKLLQEVRALAQAADLGVPVVDELAADIFMGTFTEKYLRAAQYAARVVGGSPYARYYTIDTDGLLALDDVERPERGAPTSPAFARLCHERAGVEPTDGERWTWRRPSENGAVIEQEQVLTTHNLAPLVDALGLAAALDLGDLALRAARWAVDAVERLRGPRRGRLRSVKNAAYAWRQAVVFLSFLPPDDARAVVDELGDDLQSRSASLQERIGPVVADLAWAISESDEPRPGAPLYGWGESGHRLLAPSVGAGAERESS